MTTADPTPTPASGPAPAARDRLALVLDVDDLDAAVVLARRLAPWFAVAKIGLELYAAAGPAAVGRLREEGYDVFLDVKLHDIPTQVGRAGRVLGRLGVAYLTLHTSGGEAMVRAGVDGLVEGAAAAGVPAPTALGVTVLTSDAAAPEAVLLDRIAVARAGGCGGVVCATSDLPVVRRAAPALRPIVPGIRLAGSDTHDQGRPSTPGAAITAGASLLVIGRTVTHATDPEAAAEQVCGEVAGALAAIAAPGSET